MRIFTPTLFLALLLCCSTAEAQSGGHPSHPQRPGLSPAGSSKITITLPSTTGNPKIGKALAESPIIMTIVVFNNDDKIDLLVDLPSIKFNGDPAWVDNTSTVTLFDLISQAAIAQAVADGFVACPPVCSQTPKLTRVIFPSCVRRIGLGLLTTFLNCVPGNFCYREYVVCCPNGQGTPQTHNVRNTSPGCLPLIDGSCESTCP